MEQEDPRIRMASERTLLAWIRTSIALMGFGFIVAKFGMFLRALPGAAPPGDGSSKLWSTIFGVALIMLGTIVAIMAALEHRVVIRRIEADEPYRPNRWSFGMLFTLLFCVIGVMMTVYILTT
jgi:putative membrane protein